MVLTCNIFWNCTVCLVAFFILFFKWRKIYFVLRQQQEHFNRIYNTWKDARVTAICSIILHLFIAKIISGKYQNISNKLATCHTQYFRGADTTWLKSIWVNKPPIDVSLFQRNRIPEVWNISMFIQWNNNYDA